MSRVLVIYSGGTIGMMPSTSGYAPVPGEFGDRLRPLLADAQDELPRFEVIELDPLLDSANMKPHDWNRIASTIAEHYNDFDGFVVLHGTDTLAYTASALSFMLEGLRKPIVLTGSQIPLCRSRSDGRRNLVDSLIIAGEFSIPEVVVAFQGRVLRGNRTVKVSASQLEAFDSPNYPALVEVGTRITANHDVIRRTPRGPLKVAKLGQSRVAGLRLFPGIDAGIMENLVAPPLDGLVLEAYGIGNAPVQDLRFIEVLEAASLRGLVIAVCSQCLEGQVELDAYATGRALADLGAVGVSDMTAEAAMTKLMYLIEKEADPNRVRAGLLRNLRGELTATD